MNNCTSSYRDAKHRESSLTEYSAPSERLWTDVEGVSVNDSVNDSVNYLSRFLPKLSAVNEPLRSLTRADVEWSWGQEHITHV